MSRTKIPANDPSLRSWVEIPANSDFPIQNLPFGIFSTRDTSPRPGVRIGDHVLDLQALSNAGSIGLPDLPVAAFEAPTLNPLMGTGKAGMRALRQQISDLLNAEVAMLRDDQQLRTSALIPIDQVILHLPVHVGDYTDFYSSREHATNVGTMFRDPNNALLPNWLHLPVGYHGRSSSIVISGTPIHRPKGQMKADDASAPTFGPCRLLDFELEIGFINFNGKPLGGSIGTEEADDHIFGLVLFNDWSARDIQKWEYVPLGPFLAKNFASSISPWIVTLDALEPFRVAGPVQEPEVLPYLKFSGEKNLDIQLEVGIVPQAGKETVICRSNFKYMYWNMEQQLAHHTSNGCNVRAGDLMASGTISGKDPSSYGSMLELTWRGSKPLKMSDGTERKFINDGDTVVMRGHAKRDGVRVGFGEVKGTILPAI